MIIFTKHINEVGTYLFHLGLSAELYYVRDGVVNTYAMNFEVPVPANIGELEFCWQSLTRHSVSYFIKNYFV